MHNLIIIVDNRIEFPLVIENDHLRKSSKCYIKSCIRSVLLHLLLNI